MATIPSATVTISAEAAPLAGGSGYCTVFACVGKSADGVPRVFSSGKALLSQYDYAPGVDFVASFIDETKQPVLFVGLPVATPGVLGRQNTTGVTGTCAISVAAGSEGYLEETDCSLTIVTGGTIGVNGITADFSADGGRTKKRIRLGTANSYTVPYLGIVLNFGAGTLNANDVCTFTTTAPMWDQAGLSAAKTALAAQPKASRSWMVIGDIANSTQAGYVTAATNSYETANERFVYARVNGRDRLPLKTKSKVLKRMTGAPNLTFLEVGATGDTITRSSGSFITDGFAVGDVITVALSASNNVTGPIASLTDAVITFGTTDLVNEGPVGGCTIVGSEGLTFAAGGHTVTRTSGNWLNDGFAATDSITFAGTASNNVTLVAVTVTSTVITFASGLANETIGSASVDATAGETMAAWVSNMDAALASVDAQKRIDIGLGRARKVSTIHGWNLRRPAAWAFGIREYKRDVHQTVWEKEAGPLDGWDMTDGAGKIVEYDERSDGGALAGRFSCFRTWANGPEGAFAAMSLTRDSDGSVLSYTHNMAVTNIAQTVIQAATERFIGKTPTLDDAGHLTGDEKTSFEEMVNTDLGIALLQEKVVGAGRRASKAVWSASKDDVLNIVNATVTGSCQLKVNGTVVNVNTVVKVS